CVSTSRTARSFTSGENLTARPMAPSSQAKEPPANPGRFTPEIGDVLYTKGGTTGVARAVDLSFRFQVWVHIAVLKVKRNRVVPEYLAILLNSPRAYEQAQLFTRGATNQDLGLSRMKGIWFALPPLPEQKAVLSALERETQS